MGKLMNLIREEAAKEQYRLLVEEIVQISAKVRAYRETASPLIPDPEEEKVFRELYDREVEIRAEVSSLFLPNSKPLVEIFLQEKKQMSFESLVQLSSELSNANPVESYIFSLVVEKAVKTMEIKEALDLVLMLIDGEELDSINASLTTNKELFLYLQEIKKQYDKTVKQ